MLSADIFISASVSLISLQHLRIKLLNIFYNMQNLKQMEYLIPEVEIIEVAVEQGFTNSIEDPVEKPEQSW